MGEISLVDLSKRLVKSHLNHFPDSCNKERDANNSVCTFFKLEIPAKIPHLSAVKVEGDESCLFRPACTYRVNHDHFCY